MTRPGLAIRRCMTIGNHLVERFSGAHVLISMLHPGDTADGMRFSATIHKLLSQPSPSLAAPVYQMKGLPNLSTIVREWLNGRKPGYRSVAEG